MAIISYFHRVNDAFWSEKFWLPDNMTWNDVSPPSNARFQYTSASDLLFAIPLAILMLLARYCLDKVCFRYVASYVGIKVKAQKEIPRIAVLETAYQTIGEIKHEQIVRLSKQLDWTERQVERWLRLRRASEKPPTIVKFTESCWRFVYYSTSFSLGAFCVWDKPWAWDPSKLLADIPCSITPECWWYCLMNCGFYYSLLFSQFVDVKRKDFYEMLVHHLVAIVLVSFTWVINSHRFMVMGFFMFDMCDVLLELLKIAKYAQLQKTTMILFAMMTITWMVNRWIWYPFWILKVALFDSLDMFQLCPMYFAINALLLSIAGLNAVWTYFILTACFKGLMYGPASTGDPRSCDEEETSEESEPQRETPIRRQTSSHNLQFRTND